MTWPDGIALTVGILTALLLTHHQYKEHHMPTYTFREVPLYGTKSVPCSGCGKKLRRQRKFSQTLNPFNKAADGTPKTAKQIQDELAEEIKQWEQEPETCRNCA